MTVQQRVIEAIGKIKPQMERRRAKRIPNEEAQAQGILDKIQKKLKE